MFFIPFFPLFFYCVFPSRLFFRALRKESGIVSFPRIRYRPRFNVITFFFGLHIRKIKQST